MAGLLKKGNVVGKGLFKQQKKSDPEFLASQEKVKSSLLKSLSRAIKEVHLLFANKEEEGGGTIEDCRATQQLCARFEDILRHGLKAGWFGQSTSFWPVVLKVSRKQAVEYIGSLQHAQTDNGRCRAWIRLAVNECSLESYINVLCNDTSLLGSYYETYSFLRDAEMVSALTQLLAGLSQLSINVTVDTASLEFEAVPEAYNRTMPALRLNKPTEEKQPNKVSSKHKTRKRSKQTNAIDIEDDDESTSAQSESEGTGSLAQSWSEIGSTDALDLETTEHKLPTTHEGSHVQSHDTSRDQSPKIYEEFVKYDDPQGDTGTTGESTYAENLLEWQFENEVTLDPEDGITPVLEVRSTSEDQEVPTVNHTEEPPEVASRSLSDDIDKEQSLSMSPPPNAIVIEDALVQCEVDDCEKTPMQTTSTNPFESEIEYELKAAAATVAEEDEEPLHSEDRTTDMLLSISTLTSSSVGHNPFLVEDEIEERKEKSEVSPKLPVLSNLFGELENIPNQISPPIVDLNPFSPSPPLSPTNPFLDDLQTEQSDGHLQSREVSPLEHQRVTTNLIQERDIRTPDSISPIPPLYSTEPQSLSHNSSPSLSQKPPSTSQSSQDTSPSLSPSLGPRPLMAPGGPPSDDVSSSASSLDLSMILECSSFGDYNHLQPKEDHFEAEMDMSELQSTIRGIKSELASSSGEDESKRDLRKRLVLLQLRLQKMKELEEEAQSGVDVSSGQEVLGHMFVCQPWQTKILTNVTCEGCGRKIRGLVRRWYRCKSCSCSCHKGCLSAINHMCSASKARHLQEESKYILEVCPEKGLTKQQFRCASCNQAFNSTSTIARLCDYSGNYYCPSCHHNDQAVIPARVIHNWDFSLRKVCCRCADLLNRLYAKPLIRVQQENPLLYTYVQDLVTVEVLRKELLIMKQFFIKCQAAREAQLLKHLDPFPHFKDSAKLFSLADFDAVYNSKLIPQLQQIHSEFTAHIKQDCQVCFRRGVVCKFCGSDEVLFPFDRHVRLCPHCKRAFHKTCYSEMTTCPKCFSKRTIKH